MFSRDLSLSHFPRIKIPVKISFCFPIHIKNQDSLELILLYVQILPSKVCSVSQSNSFHYSIA